MMTSAQAGLLYLWVTFAFVSILGIAAVLVWAVRSRQFTDQDRARHLPLLCDTPDADGGDEETRSAGARPEDARKGRANDVPP